MEFRSVDAAKLREQAGDVKSASMLMMKSSLHVWRYFNFCASFGIIVYFCVGSPVRSRRVVSNVYCTHVCEYQRAYITTATHI